MFSIVAPAFALVVFIYLCTCVNLPPSTGNVDEGCQWEIQTDEGYKFPTGTHRCMSSEEAPLF
jgi:hypothetical protein